MAQKMHLWQTCNACEMLRFCVVRLAHAILYTGGNLIVYIIY